MLACAPVGCTCLLALLQALLWQWLVHRSRVPLGRCCRNHPQFITSLLVSSLGISTGGELQALLQHASTHRACALRQKLQVLQRHRQVCQTNALSNITLQALLHHPVTVRAFLTSQWLCWLEHCVATVMQVHTHGGRPHAALKCLRC